MGVQVAYTEEYILLYLSQENEAKNRSLRNLANEFGVSHGVIQRALKGKFPKRKDLREKLYLVPIEEVEACLKCGTVHTTKRCTNGNHRPRPPRIAICLTNPPSAATTILKHMESNNISMLIELLNERRG